MSIDFLDRGDPSKHPDLDTNRKGICIKKKSDVGMRKTNPRRIKRIGQVSNSVFSSTRGNVSPSHLSGRGIVLENLRMAEFNEVNRKLEELFECFKDERKSRYSIQIKLKELKGFLENSTCSFPEEVEIKIFNFMRSFTLDYQFDEDLIEGLDSLQDLYHSLRGKHISFPAEKKGDMMSLPDLFKEIFPGKILRERRDFSVGGEMAERISRLCYSKILLGNESGFKRIIQRTRNECGGKKHIQELIRYFEELVIENSKRGQEAKKHQKNYQKALMNLKSLYRSLYGKTSTQGAKVTQENTSLKGKRLNGLLLAKWSLSPKEDPDAVVLHSPYRREESLEEETTTGGECTTETEEETTTSEREDMEVTKERFFLEDDLFYSDSNSSSEIEIENVLKEVLFLPFQKEIAGEEIRVSGRFNNPDCENSLKRNKTDLKNYQVRATLQAYDRVASLLFRDFSESESSELALSEKKVKVSEVLRIYYCCLLALHLPMGEANKKRLCEVYKGRDLEKDMQLLKKNLLKALCAENKSKNRQVRDFFFDLGNKMESTLESKISNVEIQMRDLDAGGWLRQGYREIPKRIRDFISRMEKSEEFAGEGCSFPLGEDFIWDDIRGFLDEEDVEKMKNQAEEAENKRINQEIAIRNLELGEEGDFFEYFSKHLEETLQMLKKEKRVGGRNANVISALEETKEKLRQDLQARAKLNKRRDQQRFDRHIKEWKSKGTKLANLRNQLIKTCFGIVG